MKLSMLVVGALFWNCLAVAASVEGGGTIGSDQFNITFCQRKSEPRVSRLAVDEKQKTLRFQGQAYHILEKTHNYTSEEIADYNDELSGEGAPYKAKSAVTYKIATPRSEVEAIDITVVTDPNQNRWAMLYGQIDIYLGSTKDCKK